MRETKFVSPRRTRPTGHGLALLALCLPFAMGCGVQIYNFGGAGRGTQFHVPAEAALNKSPVVQSWISYSLAKSTCQLQIGGDLPSENNSFKCELRPREVLAQRWATRNSVGSSISPSPPPTLPTSTTSTTSPTSSPGVSADAEQDEYLDLLLRVHEADFLEEYVWHYFRQRDWPQPDWLELSAFESWRAEHLPWHRPQTRFIGYWIEPRP